ncbi:MAG: hypothetical protein LC129_12295, partial [Burkholderiales bacterium]|nr:hypothetical protein [Burkholderiales bacterium]
MSAQGAERPILAPGWLIVVLAAMVCAALWLLYPHRDLERRLVEAGDTELSNNYLINLLRSDPDNPRLRLLLAEHQINRGDTAGASLTLQPALQGIDPALRQEAAWLHGELLYRQYQDTPETEVARRSQLTEALRPKIAELARQTWPLERQRRLSAMASELESPGVPLQAGPGEVPQDARAAALFYEKAAREALAQGDHDGSAKLYLKARSSTPDAGEARRYYFAAVATLRSGDKPQEALELAERELGPLAKDRQALELLIALARAANRPDVAERHVRELLRVSWLHRGVEQLARVTPPEGDAAAAFDDGAWLLVHPARRFALTVADRPAPARTPALPFDDKAYALGYEVFLENGKLEDAWAIANAAVRHSPDDMRWRQRLAQVSEWTGRPGSALENWLRVADATQDAAAWQGVERLATTRFDDAALMATLQTLLQGKPQDLRLRQLLMQRQLLRGDVAGAEATLRPLLAARDPALRRAGERLQTQLTQNAYTQLLGQEKVEDAWKVANEAVQKDPASTVWRERLA